MERRQSTSEATQVYGLLGGLIGIPGGAVLTGLTAAVIYFGPNDFKTQMQRLENHHPAAAYVAEHKGERLSEILGSEEGRAAMQLYATRPEVEEYSELRAAYNDFQILAYRFAFFGSIFMGIGIGMSIGAREDIRDYRASQGTRDAIDSILDEQERDQTQAELDL